MAAADTKKRNLGRGLSALLGEEEEFAAEQEHGYAATRHQRFVGAGFFDSVVNTVSGGESSMAALKGSTEEAQFHAAVEEEQHEEVAVK